MKGAKCGLRDCWTESARVAAGAAAAAAGENEVLIVLIERLRLISSTVDIIPNYSNQIKPTLLMVFWPPGSRRRLVMLSVWTESKNRRKRVREEVFEISVWRMKKMYEGNFDIFILKGKIYQRLFIKFRVFLTNKLTNNN